MSWRVLPITELCVDESLVFKAQQKKYPKALASSHIEKGEAEFYYANDEHVLAVKYRATKDKLQKTEKVVHLLSTIHSIYGLAILRFNWR